MGPKTQKLLHVLDSIISILEADRDRHWSAWMRQVKYRIEDSDFSGIELLRSVYGGMGSFNDFYLTKAAEENNHFDKLRTEAYSLSDDITHSYETNI